jgi:hypothetical protein
MSTAAVHAGRELIRGERRRLGRVLHAWSRHGVRLAGVAHAIGFAAAAQPVQVHEHERDDDQDPIPIG